MTHPARLPDFSSTLLEGSKGMEDQAWELGLPSFQFCLAHMFLSVFNIRNKDNGSDNVLWWKKHSFETQCSLCCVNLNKPLDLWVSASCSVKQKRWIGLVTSLNLFRQKSPRNLTGLCLGEFSLLLSGSISFLCSHQGKLYTCAQRHINPVCVLMFLY